jgi:hypothetical protein
VIATDACCIQLDILEQDVFEILHLIRSWRNRLAPVNRIPPEILALVPDFWNDDDDDDDRDQDIITLTHVCRVWREVFTSRSSLWTSLNCENKDQAHVYLERSKSLPVNLSLCPDDDLPTCHPFFKIIPRAIGRLGSLSIEVMPEDLQAITAHLSHPAPLLEELSICCDSGYDAHRNPVLTPALFNGDLSSLRKLRLECVRTELPWKNMANLTSFKLAHTPPDEVTVRQLLDFFEGAPRLRTVDLHSVTLAPSAHNGRLVSLACLEMMGITGSGSASLLLNHLLIPVGANLKMEVDLPSPPIKDHPPRFLDNLRNLPNFTTIDLCGANGWKPHIQFNGPNGQVRMIPRTFRVNRTRLVIKSLDQFDTSRIEQLTINHGNSSSSDSLYRALLPMKHLHTLTLRHCARSHIFIYALHPDMNSSGVLVCPKLEELVIVLGGGTLDVKSVIGVVAARAARGAKVTSVRITGRKSVETDILELRKHVLHVECGPEVDGANNDSDSDSDSDDTDEED